MPNISLAFVFAHGSWQEYLVAPLLEACHVVRPPDPPRAGKNAKLPCAHEGQPLDAAAFANEPSPNAQVTQQERARAVIDLSEELEPGRDRSIVPVDHSLAGLTVTAVAEDAPERLSTVEYFAASLLPGGMTAQDRASAYGGRVVPSLFPADPVARGRDANRSTLGAGGLSYGPHRTE